MSATRASYERLIEDLRSEYRPQRAWGEGRSLFMVIGHFVVGLAAGAWLFGLLYESRACLALSLVLGALGGVAHLVNLGRPERFWRMAAEPGRSWVARGFWGLSAFLLGALLYLVPLWLPGVLWGGGSWLAQLGWLLAILGMLVLMGYMGFVYSSSKAIPFWNSPLHPALYVGYALRGGVAGLLLVQAFGARSIASFHELLLWWIVLSALVAALFVLELHGAWTGGNAAAKRSVEELFAGRLALAFYGGILVLGLAVPAALVWYGLYGQASLLAMALLAIASALGDFFMKYSSIRAGFHLPVWTRRTAPR
jgi:formate-dependent nitrite reductase membrane component NrfD